jgi:hypothetical protein
MARLSAQNMLLPSEISKCANPAVLLMSPVYRIRNQRNPYYKNHKKLNMDVKCG